MEAKKTFVTKYRITMRRADNTLIQWIFDTPEEADKIADILQQLEIGYFGTSFESPVEAEDGS